VSGSTVARDSSENRPAGRGSRGRRRAALLDAAVQEIAEHGTRGMRVERVAKLAGVSPALIYHHFEDRSTLLNAALAHIGDVADRYAPALDDAATGRERLLAALAAEIQDDEIVRRNSAAWSELRNSAIFDESVRETFVELADRWAHDLAELVEAGQRDGSVDRKLGAPSVGVQLSTLVEGVSGRWLCHQLDTSAARELLNSSASAILGVPNRRSR
jgi:AcrR family transcriptional regulator